MSIENRGGAWYYRFKVKGTEHRKPTGLAATNSNLSAAKRIEASAKLAAIARQAEPRQMESRSLGFTEAAERFLSWCFSTEYRNKQNTARRIKTSFASLVCFFGDSPVGAIESSDVESYKAWRIKEHGVRDVTLRHDLHALSVFYRKYAIKNRWATANPTADVTKPSDADAIRIYVLSPEEEARYFAVARGSLYDVARLILLQGCRPEEIMALRHADVDLKAGRMRIAGGKTPAARRTLDLTQESLEILRRRLREDGKWVFPSPRTERAGEHITKLNGAHDRACIEAGVSFRLYDLRHTFATRLLADAGVDLFTAAAIMGHSGISMLRKYVHPTAQHMSDAMRRYEQIGAKPALRRVK